MILLTGATGKLGGQVADQLAKQGADFKCLARRSEKAQELEAKGIAICYGDITDRTALEKAMEDVDAVISCHSLGLPKKDVTCWEVDYQGNIDLIARLKKNGGGKFVYISALGVRIDSAFPLYKAKVAIENHLKISGLDTTIFRPSGFFSDFTMAAPIVKKYRIYPMMGSGTHKIQAINEADLAACAIAALTNKKASGKTFSIGGPETITLRQVAAAYADILGYTVRPLPIPSGVQKPLAFIIDGLTGYRFSIQGFLEAFGGDSLSDNGPLFETFDVQLSRFEDYLRDYLA